MNGWQVSPRLAVGLVWWMISFASIAVLGMGLPAIAQDAIEQVEGQTEAVVVQPLGLSDAEEQLDDLDSTLLPEPVPSPEPIQLNDIDQPAATVEAWIAQIEASLVQITGVRVETTETGLQVVLETENGALEVPETRSVGNALIADIPDATIAEEFSQADPSAGIALVSVTGLPGDRVRVAITGTDAPPVAEVTSEAQGLVLAVTLGDADAVAEEDTIEVVVTGEQDEGYNPSSASTATRTDTPLRDIPQSIQVVPREVLDDRNVRGLTEAVETVAGVVEGGDGTRRIIRGFTQEGNFRNGLRDVEQYGVTPSDTIERVEVLRGPASVLFGQVEPGGIINVVTRQPLREPYYNLAFEVGNYELYQPRIDLSGPLTDDDTVLYRLIASYQNSNPIPDPTEISETVVAPSITLNFGDRTSLNLYYEYSNFTGDPYWYNTGIFADGSLFPRNFFNSYPSLARAERTTQRYGYALRHEFNDDWQIRNSFTIAAQDNSETNVFGYRVENDRVLTDIEAYDFDDRPENYFGQIDLLGRFNTGSISHQVLIGFDFNRLFKTYRGFFSGGLPDLDIFDPDYDIPDPDFVPFLRNETVTQSYGVYLQDQIAFTDNLKLLIGGRYDWISYRDEIFDFGTLGNTTEEPFQNDGAFSPRIGLVYQPTDEVSLYASYSRSFRQSTELNPDGRAFKPTRGTQYEVGVRTEFLDSRLSTNLAAYHLTKTNVTTPESANPLFSVQTGEQSSQGVELDVTGEILPGWNITLAYAYTDAEVTEDNSIPEGNRLANVPENQASLWTTYTIQEGVLEGLGFGLGLFYVGERQGDLANSFQIGDYLRTDAALYYRRGRFRGAINVRNLFDIDYAEWSGESQTFLIRRGDPFTIVGSVSWEF